MRLKLIVAALVGLLAAGCVKSEVTQEDAARNRAAFSNEAYEAAMRKAGKGAELEAQKQREAAYQSGDQR